MSSEQHNKSASNTTLSLFVCGCRSSVRIEARRNLSVEQSVFPRKLQTNSSGASAIGVTAFSRERERERKKMVRWYDDDGGGRVLSILRTLTTKQCTHREHRDQQQFFSNRTHHTMPHRACGKTLTAIIIYLSPCALRCTFLYNKL